MAASLLRTASSIRYGLVAQACSSATNFGLVVVAGHVLGPSGVGTLFVGFTGYLVLLGLERGLVAEPLVVVSSGANRDQQAVRARYALTLTLAATIPAAGIFTGIGLLLPDHLGRGMLLFAPWLVPALVQDLGRSILFRDRSGGSAALSDASWLVTMAAAVALAVELDSDLAVVGCWGVGAMCGAVVALVQIRWTPTRLTDSAHWWKTEASRFGRWRGMSVGTQILASYSSVLALISILGAREFGGLRAVQTVFAPLTLLGPAVSLPGLPLVSGIVSAFPRRALLVALRYGVLMMTVAGVYVVVLYAFPGSLGFFFGQEFAEFRSIVVPIGLGQIALAFVFSLTLFLKAQQRGRTLFWLYALQTLLNVTFAVVFASLFGLTGAAWAGVVATLLYVALLVVVVRPTRISAVPARPAAAPRRE
jgi:O-antigen/teichoic acid export membrane protein